MKHFIYNGICIVHSYKENLADYGITYQQLNYKIFRVVQKNKKFIKQNGRLYNFINLNKEYVVVIQSTLSRKGRIVVLADTIMKDINPADITIQIFH